MQLMCSFYQLKHKIYQEWAEMFFFALKYYRKLLLRQIDFWILWLFFSLCKWTTNRTIFWQSWGIKEMGRWQVGDSKLFTGFLVLFVSSGSVGFCGSNHDCTALPFHRFVLPTVCLFNMSTAAVLQINYCTIPEDRTKE